MNHDRSNSKEPREHHVRDNNVLKQKTMKLASQQKEGTNDKIKNGSKTLVKSTKPDARKGLDVLSQHTLNDILGRILVKNVVHKVNPTEHVVKIKKTKSKSKAKSRSRSKDRSKEIQIKRSRSKTGSSDVPKVKRTDMVVRVNKNSIFAKSNSFPEKHRSSSRSTKNVRRCILLELPDIDDRSVSKSRRYETDQTDTDEMARKFRSKSKSNTHSKSHSKSHSKGKSKTNHKQKASHVPSHYSQGIDSEVAQKRHIRFLTKGGSDSESFVSRRHDEDTDAESRYSNNRKAPKINHSCATDTDASLDTRYGRCKDDESIVKRIIHPHTESSESCTEYIAHTNSTMNNESELTEFKDCAKSESTQYTYSKAKHEPIKKSQIQIVSDSTSTPESSTVSSESSTSVSSDEPKIIFIKQTERCKKNQKDKKKHKKSKRDTSDSDSFEDINALLYRLEYDTKSSTEIVYDSSDSHTEPESSDSSDNEEYSIERNQRSKHNNNPNTHNRPSERTKSPEPTKQNNKSQHTDKKVAINDVKKVNDCGLPTTIPVCSVQKNNIDGNKKQKVTDSIDTSEHTKSIFSVKTSNESNLSDNASGGLQSSLQSRHIKSKDVIEQTKITSSDSKDFCRCSDSDRCLSEKHFSEKRVSENNYSEQNCTESEKEFCSDSNKVDHKHHEHKVYSTDSDSSSDATPTHCGTKCDDNCRCSDHDKTKENENDCSSVSSSSRRDSVKSNSSRSSDDSCACPTTTMCPSTTSTTTSTTRCPTTTVCPTTTSTTTSTTRCPPTTKHHKNPCKPHKSDCDNFLNQCCDPCGSKKKLSLFRTIIIILILIFIYINSGTIYCYLADCLVSIKCLAFGCNVDNIGSDDCCEPEQCLVESSRIPCDVVELSELEQPIIETNTIETVVPAIEEIDNGDIPEYTQSLEQIEQQYYLKCKDCADCLNDLKQNDQNLDIDEYLASKKSGYMFDANEQDVEIDQIVDQPQEVSDIHETIDYDNIIDVRIIVDPTSEGPRSFWSLIKRLL